MPLLMGQHKTSAVFITGDQEQLCLLSNGHRFESKQVWWENFLLQSQLYMLSHTHVTAAVKNPIHSAKCEGGRLQLNTQAPYIYGFEYGCIIIINMVLQTSQDFFCFRFHHLCSDGAMSHACSDLCLSVQAHKHIITENGKRFQ